MASTAWGNPVDLIAPFRAQHGEGEHCALLMWAQWSVDHLRYLSDLDATVTGESPAYQGHAAETVDVAHVRWATGSCMTALDLCAAALGRVYGPAHPRGHEYDLEGLRREPRGGPPPKEWLPDATVDWITNVVSDHRYPVIKWARDRLTHRRVYRHFSIGGVPQRLKVTVDETKYPVRELVEMSRDLATDWVGNFLLVVVPDL